MQEMQVLSLGQEDALEEEMATHSSILPGICQGQRSLAGYSPWGRNMSDRTEYASSCNIYKGDQKMGVERELPGASKPNSIFV